MAFTERFLPLFGENSRFLIVFLALLFTAAFLARVWGLSYLHSWDEMVYLQNAKVICCGKTNYSELDFRPPLLSLLYAGVFLIRDHIYAASIFTAALNALAPVLLFLSGRRVVGVLPSLLASLLLAFGPFFAGTFPDTFDSDATGNSLLTDCPALTLVLLGLWLMLRALDAPKLWRFALAGFALSLAILMRFGSIPSVALLSLLPLLAANRSAGNRWKALAATGAGIAAGLTPYLFWSWRAYGGFLTTLRTGWKNVEGPSPPATFYFTNAPAIFTWIGVVGLLFAVIVALAHRFRWKEAKPELEAALPLAALPANRQRLQAFLWIWLLAGLVFFSRMPHKEPRYILPLAPPVLLLSGTGLALLCRLPGRVLKPLGALLLTVAMAAAFLPTVEHFTDPFIDREQSEELAASKFLNASTPSSTALYMNFNYPAFAYFTSFPIHVLPVYGPEVYPAIDRIPAGGILIAYRESESGEPKIAVLNNDPHLEVVKAYASLVIYRRKQTGQGGAAL